MAVIDTKDAIPEDAQASFIWLFLENTFLTKLKNEPIRKEIRNLNLGLS